MADVLFVDDEASVRSVLSKILQKAGYSFVGVSDASEARGYLEKQRFDLILCDIRMPGESGLDLIRHVKKKYPDTAIVMVTAIDDPQEAKTALEIGVYGYVIKPFEANQILISVANALRRRELEMKERTYRQDLERIVKERTADLLETNEALRKREAELKARTNELKEVNSALRVLLKKREEDKGALEENILINVKRTVAPYLEKLKGGGLNNEQKRTLEILESNIKEIISPFVKELSSAYLDLTPTEIHVANLIKQGKTTKEIAAILNLSENTIMSHRFNIRRKLGLLKAKTNLHTFPHSLK